MKLTKKYFAVLLSVVMLFTLLPAVAASAAEFEEDSDAMAATLSDAPEEEIHDYGYNFSAGKVTFSLNPNDGTLTIDSGSNALENVEELAKYIRQIAPKVKTVYITRKSLLRDTVNYCFLFALMENMVSFKVQIGNPLFVVRNGVLYSEGLGVLVHYPAAKPDKSFHIPSMCMGIADFAFCNTKYLEEIYFPYSHINTKIAAPIIGDNSFIIFDVGTCSLCATDLLTGEERECSVKKITYYGTPEEFAIMGGSAGNGNDMLRRAEVVSSPTNGFRDLFFVFKYLYHALIEIYEMLAMSLVL